MTAVVALHGFTGTGAAWDVVHARLRAGIDERLRADTRLRFEAPDLPGHGRHAERFDDAPLPRSWDEAVDRLADAIRRVAAEHGDADVVLAGYSLGARLALGVLVEHPGLVRAALLVGVRPGLDDAGSRARRVAADDALAVALETDGLEAFVERWQALPLFASQRALPADVLQRQRATRLAQDPAGLAWSLRVLSLGRMPAYGARLASVTVPVRLLVGRLDVPFHEPMSAMAAALPEAELRQIAGAGHNLILETPGPVAEAIQEMC